MNHVATLQKRSLVDSMAARYDMEPAAFVSAIKATVIKGDCSNEQFAAFLMVAKEYDLNPLTKEIYAFPDRGGITPIVSIDGWMNLINSHPQFDGMEFTDTHGDDGKLSSVECRMFRKDRARPISVIEYMSECYRQTDPWKKWPNRMLRHKAAIQCARYAFGFSGIMEPDEYERMRDVTPAPATSVMDRLKAQNATQEPQGEREGFSRSFIADQTEEPSDALTGEIIDNTNSAAADQSPSGQSPDDDEAAPASSQEDGGDGNPRTGSSPSSAISDEDRRALIECCFKLMFIPIDPDLQRQESKRGVLETSKNAWKLKLGEHLHPHLKSFFQSADAVIKGEADRDKAISEFAYVLECTPEELGGAA